MNHVKTSGELDVSVANLKGIGYPRLNTKVSVFKINEFLENKMK